MRTGECRRRKAGIPAALSATALGAGLAASVTACGGNGTPAAQVTVTATPQPTSHAATAGAAPAPSSAAAPTTAPGGATTTVTQTQAVRAAPPAAPGPVPVVTGNPGAVCGFDGSDGMISVVGYGVVCNYLSGDLNGNFAGEAWTPGSAATAGAGATCGVGPSPSGSYVFAYDTSADGADTSLAEQICSTASSVWFNY